MTWVGGTAPRNERYEEALTAIARGILRKDAHVDSVLISPTTVLLLKGTTAMRFLLSAEASAAVARHVEGAECWCETRTPKWPTTLAACCSCGVNEDLPVLSAVLARLLVASVRSNAGWRIRASTFGSCGTTSAARPSTRRAWSTRPRARRAPRGT